MKNVRDIILPVLNDLQSGVRRADVSELSGAAKALFLLSLWQEARTAILVITATEEAASLMIADLEFFAHTDLHDTHVSTSTAKTGRVSDQPVILPFPAWGLLPFEADSPDSGTIGERMRFLSRLVAGTAGIFVVSVRSLMQKLPPRKLLADSLLPVSKATQIDPDTLASRLVSLGYEPASMVTRVGEFSRRGGIIDFFSPDQEHPLRLEFFGDTVESLRAFDIESQRSLGEIPAAIILPVRELLLTDDGLQALADHAGNEAFIGNSRERILSPGAEFLAPLLYEMESLFTYVPDDSIITFVEPEYVERTAEEYWERIIQGRQEEIAEGRALPAPEEFYLDYAAIQGHCAYRSVMNLRLLSSPGTPYALDTRSSSSLGVRLTKSLDRNAKQDRPVEGSIAVLADKLMVLRKKNRIAVICGTAESAFRLQNLFSDYGLEPVVSGERHANDTGPWPVTFVPGRLSGGFSWPDLNLIFITEEEMFGSKVHRPKPAPSRTAPFLSSFKELQSGDFVVHTDYGVGEYQGLTHLSVDGFETDYLTLRYEPDAKLYVPLYSLDKVQKYLGLEGSKPRLDRLGAPAWNRTKARIKKDILEIARELVSIYASRAAHERTPFSPPDSLYREFEAAFPYEETPDQQRAIEDILNDMQKSRPMDRLVCGDVGYGKTEVALRATFMGVENGVQVAVLVPTTLLADQHHRTFTERLDPFGITVEMLSRYRTRSQQTETIRRLRNGTADIVVGTHRLLQKDVSFKNLGLLVVDEEHRFGVRHKERIKEMKTLVDVLTLTATPIPRTLHMSLSGIRDLSIIQTPPLDRQAVQVVVARFGKRIIREAIVQEIDRGGTVFFVHNRVQGIQRLAEYVQNLVPEAVVGVAHGQMKEDEIEPVMKAFIAGTVNVLVTTTIIESGIDIPSANTMIINRADRFGLAELYQIKGRVGRSRQKAFAYLLTPAEEALPEPARKRLRAIQELSELGAGFRIAAQDLETRGAGNLLGKQQSGHIAAIGIDLYTQMMEEAMAELRGEAVPQEADTLINVRASAFIPDDYIGDMSLRLAAYKELSSVDQENELADLVDSLNDRYGHLPEPAANLIDIMKIKLIARRSGVARIDAGTKHVNITFAEHAPISSDAVMMLIKNNKNAITLIPEYTLQITLHDNRLGTVADTVKKCLQELQHYVIK